MNNLFFIESPLQLLSAKEARDQYKKSTNVLLVSLQADKNTNNNKQILSIIDKDWDRVLIKKNKKNKYLNVFNDCVHISKLTFFFRGKVDKYYYGEHRNIFMNVLSSLLNVKETILLDDGTFTILAQNNFILLKRLPFEKRMLYKLVNRFITFNYNPNLFSMFLFPKMLDGQVNYYKHKKKRKLPVIKGDVWFFGSKLSEAGIVDYNDEISLLKKIKDKYKEFDIHYLPHREEVDDKIKAISEIGFKIKIIDKPAEIYFDELNSIPEVMASYYSTVLYSAYLKFSDICLTSIDVRSYMNNDVIVSNSTLIYDYYSNLNFFIDEI